MNAKAASRLSAVCIALFTFLAVSSRANNIVVTNISLTSINTNAGFMYVQFDLAWQNSWRVSVAPANWDAAWVFVKFQKADGIWRHAHLSTNNTDHLAPPGSSITVGMTSNNAVGVFIFRSTNGVGYASWPAVSLRWNYDADGVLPSDSVSVDVTGIEMVYVPTGPFSVGDGISSSTLQNGSNFAQPYQITNGGPITLSDAPGNLWSSTISTNLRGSQVTAPNGYNAFYCMKYECSIDQLLHYQALTGRAWSPPPDNSGFQMYLDRSTQAALYRSMPSQDGEVLLYLQWTALRPMGELEYEKACRGPVTPVPHEYPWGTAIRANQIYTLTNDGTAAESVSANYSQNTGNTWDINTAVGTRTGTGGNRPVNYGTCRVGIFALSAYGGTTPPRIQSGASYYGIMDLSGNVAEPVYPITTGTNLVAFSGAHGDGNTSGNVAGWPSFTLQPRGGGIDEVSIPPSGSGFYSYYAGGVAKAVSDRTVTFTSPYTSGTFTNHYGIRGVRTAP